MQDFNKGRASMNDCPKHGSDCRCVELSGPEALSLAIILLGNVGIVATGIALSALAIAGVIG